MTARERWFLPNREAVPTAEDALQLFCLPHAGAGASAYRDWAPLLAPSVKVVGVQPPGRENRFADPYTPSATLLSHELAEAVAERAQGAFALFGHSMGALLAYETAHRLAALGRAPACLFVSGYWAPQLPHRRRQVHLLPEDELIRQLRDLEGTVPEVLDHPKLLEFLLPLIRADFELCETYRWSSRPLLDVPVVALGGASDPGVEVPPLAAWGSSRLPRSRCGSSRAATSTCTSGLTRWSRSWPATCGTPPPTHRKG